MPSSPAGYREIEHTADWQLDVWAPDLGALLEQAARGMYALAGVRLADGPRQAYDLEVPFYDSEGLLVTFLSELLYLGEEQGLAFDTFDLQITGSRLHAALQGAPLAALNKEIKAVTYHKLAVQQTEHGLEVSIVFDV